jgi:signal transduction histidine kinase
MALARASGVVIRDPRPNLAHLLGIASLPTEELVRIATTLLLVRAGTLATLSLLSAALHATLVPSLPWAWIGGASAVALAVTLPHRLWTGSRAALVTLIGVQSLVDVTCLGVAFAFAPDVPLRVGALVVLLPIALVAPIASLVVASEARAAKSTEAALEAESAAATAAALLTVGRALAGEPTRSALLERVADLARELAGSTWACILVRDPERNVYRIMGLASRTGQLDEEILSMVFPEAFVQWMADTATDDCLDVRSSEGSPLDSAFRTRWTIGPFIVAVLRREDQTLGVLMVGQDDPETAFRPTTRRLVVGIAHQAVLALENTRLLDELRVANALKTDFIGAMSHELRSPLHAITGYAEMLRDEASAQGPDAVRERVDMLDRVHVYTSQLLELIQATLDLSRLETGRVPLNVELVDLDGFVGELRAGIPEYWRKSGVELEWIVPSPLASAQLDSAKLRTVIRNLIDNAFKFTEEGKVTVHLVLRFDPSLAPTAGTVPADLVVTVSDTGVGIPPEHRETIFEMFRQGDSSFSRKYGGVGLGLYIVRRLLHAIGGVVHVDSEPGRGSSFEVIIPVSIPDERQATVRHRAVV